MRAVILAALLSATCAAHRVPSVEPTTPHVWIPQGVPNDVVVCIALPQQRRWSCLTVGELRVFFATLRKA